MSWLYSRALAEEYWAASCSDGARSVRSKSTPTTRAYLPKDRMTDFSRPSRFGMTFGVLTDALGEELLTWFLAASRARTSPAPEKARGSTASGPACGGKCTELSARYDPGSRSWKTRQCSLFEDSPPFLGRFPNWGMMRDGELYRLPTPELLTSENGCGYWPTPRAGCPGSRKPGTGGRVLAEEVQRVPTPRALMGGNKTDTGKCRLEEVVGAGGSLNPTWVEWLMGWALGWTDLKPLATDRFRRWLDSHGNR